MLPDVLACVLLAFSFRWILGPCLDGGVPDALACVLLAFFFRPSYYFKQGHGVVQVRLNRAW